MKKKLQNPFILLNGHKQFLFLCLCFLLGLSGHQANAQVSTSLAKFVTPPFISGCNNDTIRIEVTNLFGTKGVTYSGPVKIAVTIPANPNILYVGGSVSSLPAGATSTTAAGATTLNIDVPLPALGKTTVVKFVIRADCNLLKLPTLPQFTATVTYPTPYPTTSETISSAVLSVGNAQLNVSGFPSSRYFNENLSFGKSEYRGLVISNGGYGSIDNITVTLTQPDALAIIDANTWKSPAYSPQVGPELIPISTTPIAGGKTVRVYKISGANLGPDGLLTPGEGFVFSNQIKAPNTCGTFDSEFKVEYQCAGGAVSCDKPQIVNDRTTVGAGTPKLEGKIVSIEYPDGCPKKKIVYDVTNTATGNGAPEGNAYDVKLGINLGTGKAILSTVTLGGVAVPNASISGGLSYYIIDATTFTTDPDGAGGLEDLDGDGKFDDMKPNAKTTISFFYTIPCDIACGADFDYNFSSTNTFTDFCRTLAGVTSTPLAQFGFAQVQPIEQNNKVDYGIVAANASVKRNVRFNFQYKANNINLTAGVATLCINYSRKFEFDPASVKLNGVAITGTIQGVDMQASTSATNPAQTAASRDSAWVHILTAAETAALFDANPDSLSYSQTYYGCVDRQNTKSGDNWQLKFRAKAGLCTDGSTPCTFDLACKKPFIYGSGNGCGSKPCWKTDFTFFRDKFVGSTDVTRVTPINPRDSTRSYVSDTVALNIKTFFAGKWYGEPIGQSASEPFILSKQNDITSYFNFTYSVPVGYKNGVSPWIFLPNYSTVVVRKRTPNAAAPAETGTLGPIIFTAPLLQSDFASFAIIPTTSTLPRANAILTPLSYLGNLTESAYYCVGPGAANGGNWSYRSCPLSDYVEYGSNWTKRSYNQVGDKVDENYYIYFAEALARAGYTGPSNDDEYYYEIKTRWIMNPDFPWDNTNSYSFIGGTQKRGNISDVPDTNSPSSSYTGACNDATAVGTTVTKKHFISNPKQTYNSACGLRVSHKVDFKSFAGNYFRVGEVRVPLTIDKIVVKIPSEYSLATVPNISLKYNQSCATQTYTGITAAGVTGTVTFTNPTSTTGGDYPRADDCSGFTTAYDLCYDLRKTGSAAPTNYKLPIEIYTKDEFGNVMILRDTASIAEADPILTMTALASSVIIDDGKTPSGKVCSSFYTDYKITNNSLFDAPNVYLAAKGNANVTITNIQDVNPATPLLSADTSRYTVVNMFGKLGTVKAGDTRVIRVFATTSVCTDKIDVVADFICEYPTGNTPDESVANTNLLKASTTFTAQDPAMQSKPISDLKVTDLCAVKTLEFEILNTSNPNLYKMKSTLTLPAGVTLVAGSAKAGVGTAQGFAGYYPILAANVTGSGTSYVFDFKDSSPFKTTECGLPGADERPANYVRLSFDVDFSACPVGGAAQLLLQTDAENFCGKKVSAKASANLDFVGNSIQNNFDLSHKDNPITVCSPKANVPVVVNDVVYIRNLGGYGALSGLTTGADFVTLALPHDGTLFSITAYNLTTSGGAFGTAVVGTDAAGAPSIKIIVPAGIKVGDSLAVPVTYTITPKVAKLCANPLAVLCIYGSFESNFALKCAAKSLDCKATRTTLSNGLTPRTFLCCYGSIGDYVWKDTNKDGQQGLPATEPPVAGVKVILYSETSPGIYAKADSMITLADGKYLFDSLFTGNYKVQFIAPTTSDLFTTPKTGATATDSDAGVNGFSDIVPIDATLASGSIGRDNLTIDAGIILCTKPTTTASIISPTCAGATAQSNGMIKLTGFTTEKYQYVTGSTFTGTATPASPTVIPSNSILISTLTNTAQTFTVRIYTATDNACYIDRTISLVPVVCVCPPVKCVNVKVSVN